MTFCARTVIHSTWRCHSGSTFDAALGGGARSAPRKDEYVTSMDFRMDKSAGRRSAKWGREGVKKVCEGIHSKAVNKRRTSCGVLWIQLMASHLSKRGDRLLELEGAVAHRPSTRQTGEEGLQTTYRRTHCSVLPRVSNPRAVSPAMLEANLVRRFDPKGSHFALTS